MTNNKVKGTQFENDMCEMLAGQGWWVHFIQPKPNGAQPFDIIAVRDGTAMAIDCKTCVNDTFSMGRLENNQRFAFDKWIACGNTEPQVAVLHDNKVFMVGYITLRERGRVHLQEDEDGVYCFKQNQSD